MADNVTVGRVLGRNALGNYAMAYSLASVPIALLTSALGGVLFPAYSEVAKEGSKRVLDVLVRVFSVSSLLLLAITIPMLLLAEEIVAVLYGSKWSEAASVLRVLVLVIPLRGAMLVVSTLFLGLNKPKLVAVGKVIEAVLFLALLYPMTCQFGVTGAAWSAVIVYTVGLVNRLGALGGVVPGAPAKLAALLSKMLLAGSIGFLAGRLSLTFLTLPLTRIFVGSLVSAGIGAVLLLLFSVEIRRSLADLRRM